PEHPTHRLAAEPGAAPLVGKRQTPSADPVLPAADDRPADTAGTGDNNPAIASMMRPDTGGMRIAGDHGVAERQPPRSRRCQFGRLGRAGEREARRYAPHRRLTESGVGEALPGGVE